MGGKLGLNSGVHSYGLSDVYGAGRVKYEYNWLLLEQCLRRSKRAGRGCVRMKIKKTRGNVYERVDRSGVIRLHASRLRIIDVAILGVSHAKSDTKR